VPVSKRSCREHIREETNKGKSTTEKEVERRSEFRETRGIKNGGEPPTPRKELSGEWKSSTREWIQTDELKKDKTKVEKRKGVGNETEE